MFAIEYNPKYENYSREIEKVYIAYTCDQQQNTPKNSWWKLYDISKSMRGFSKKILHIKL